MSNLHKMFATKISKEHGSVGYSAVICIKILYKNCF